MHILPVIVTAGFLGFIQTANAELSVARQQELIHLLRHDCGSCHGITLQGGLGPALTAEVLKDKSVEMLTATIHHGRPGTPMPPWKDLLSQQDIDWMVQQLRTGGVE